MNKPVVVSEEALVTPVIVPDVTSDDVAKTSLPRRFRFWKQMVDDQTIVIVWHKDLKGDPKANAGLILA